MAKNGFKIIDSDMHIMEPPDLWEKYIDKKYRDRAPRGVTSKNVRDLRLAHPDGSEWARTPTAPAPADTARGRNFEEKQILFGDDAKRGWTSEVQLEAMDHEGLDIAVLYPTRGLRAMVDERLDPPFAAAVARAYNDWMYDFCQRDPKRLIGAGMISPYSMEDAVSEARRCAEQLGFRAIFMRANPLVDQQWQSEYYEPLWDALEALNMSIGFHESTNTGKNQIGERLNPNFMLRRVFAQPLEQMLALGCFCGGGVLARHPKLRAAFLEANCSWLPWLLWRLDEAWELDGDVFAPQLKNKPSDYFRRQCVVSIEPDEVVANSVVEQFGSGNLVFSTDYPHVDSRYPEAVNYFLRLPLADEDKRKILWDNCAAYYAM